MGKESDREAFRNLLVEYFALKTAEDLEEIQLPEVEQMEKFTRIASPKADEVLRNYEASTASKEITERVLTDLKGALVARSRLTHILEVALNLSLLLVGLLAGYWNVVLDPVEDPGQSRAVMWVIVIIATLQLFGNLYLRYFDRNR